MRVGKVVNSNSNVRLFVLGWDKKERKVRRQTERDGERERDSLIELN